MELAPSVWDLFEAEPLLFAAAVGVVGLLIGSFLNVVIARVPRRMEQQWALECRDWLEHTGADSAHLPAGPAGPTSLVTPASCCPACGAPIRARDNIPILGWLLLRGRCRDCGAGISIQYPLVEAAAAALGLVVALHLGPGWPALLVVIFTWTLLAASVIDLNTMLLPDELTLPLLWLGLLAAVAGVGLVQPTEAIIGAAAGYGALWLVYHGFRLVTGKEGMGYGDFKLLAAIGAWTGWQTLPIVVLLASAVGAIVGIGLILLRGQDRTIPIPFGPYLAAGGWIGLLWGDAIAQGYLRWALG